MKKNLFLMLTLIILSAASMNAQVTIGSTDDPHSGAILDLQSTTQGLKLPTVPITDLATFGLPLEGTSTLRGAIGMVVYNTFSGTGAGLYVWTGASWSSITPCTAAPATPGTITFSALAVSPGTTFTASFPPVLYAKSYLWTLPPGLSAPSLTTTEPAITITGTTIGTYDGSDIKVVAINTCGNSEARAGSGSIWVADCATTPTQPKAITFNFRTVDLGRTITATVEPVANATAYVWQLPTGLSAPELTPILPTLTITGDEVGSYAAAGIKVAAKTCDNVGLSGEGEGAQIVCAINPNWGTVEGASGTIYTTYDLGEYGIFMTDMSKEGNYFLDTYPGRDPGERGYYYTYAQAHAVVDGPCPAGWRLPTRAEITAIFGSGVDIETRKNRLLIPSTLNGRCTGSGWLGWGSDSCFAYEDSATPIVSDNGTTYAYAVRVVISNGNPSWLTGSIDPSEKDYYNLSGVRCIKL
jgi:hypothetical protein